MKPVKWGVLGVSYHYKLRVSNPIKKVKSLEMSAIASRSLEKAENAATELGIPKAYGSYDELIRDPDIEAVYIPLPNHLHAEWVKKAADQGKHVLCEKPFTCSAEETAEVLRYARDKGVLVMEAFMYKLHPKWRYARTLLAVGEIGRIQAVHSFFSYDLKDPSNIRNKPEMGGGGIYDIGCYAVSSARFLTGMEPERVISLVAHDPALSVDILTSAILDFGSNVRAVFTVGTQSFPYQRVQVFGSDGTMQIDNPFNIFPDVPGELLIRNGVGTRTVETAVADQYAIEFDEFSHAVRTGDPLPIQPEDAVLNQKVLDALIESGKSGGWVSL